MTEHYKYVVHGYIDDPRMDIVNIYYVRFDAAFTPTGSQATAYLHSLYDPMLPYLSAGYTIDYLGISHWEGPSDGIWMDTTVTPNVPKKNPPWSVENPIETAGIDGAATGEMLPPQVAALMYGKTAVKHVIARKFIGPLAEIAQAGGTLVSLANTAFQGMSNEWLIAWQGSGGPVGTAEVWGYKHGFNALTSVHADDILSTNRRRKIGRGS